MNIFKLFLKPFKKIDDIREFIEDQIAKGLDKIAGSEKVDSLERVAADAIMTAIELYMKRPIPQDVKNKIKEGVVNGCNKANPIISTQLKKK